MLLQNVFLVSLVLATCLFVQGTSGWKFGIGDSPEDYFNEGSDEYNYSPEWEYGFGDHPRYDANKIDHRQLNMRPRFSTPAECTRDCKVGEKPRYCLYNFTLEFYTTMGRACDLCKPNNTNQIASVPNCQCIEADGFERGMVSINRMLPGPSIQVCQNDVIVVDVRNNVEGIEAALHWHGMWQKGSQYYDGVPFLTQCPIPSGTTFRYQFVASNPGTHFYHSHSGVQKIDGQYGSLIVRQPRDVDPHSKLYDIDSPTNVIVLSDWMHEMSIARFPGRRTGNKRGQIPESILINGKGLWMNSTTNQSIPDQLESVVVQPGKRYRFRLINSFSSVCHAQMTIEGHNLTLIAQDGESVSQVPINTIISSSGERVDFILNTNQPIGTYWIQVRATGSCTNDNITQFAILRYAGGPATPRTRPSDYQKNVKLGIIYNDPNVMCDDQRPNVVCASQLKSIKSIPTEIFQVEPDHRLVLSHGFFVYENSTQQPFRAGSYPRFLVAPDASHIVGLVDNISFAFPPVPPLSQKLSSSDTCNRNRLPKNCGTPCSCPHTHEIKKGAVVEVIVYNEDVNSLNHPFHLHGYAFYLFKIGQFSNKTITSINNIDKAIKEHNNTLIAKKYKQPAGKDTIAVPSGGYVIFRFKADNPGWWLFHCHFLYHTAVGMSVILHVGEQKDLPRIDPTFPSCHSYTPELFYK